MCGDVAEFWWPGGETDTASASGQPDAWYAVYFYIGVQSADGVFVNASLQKPTLAIVDVSSYTTISGSTVHTRAMVGIGKIVDEQWVEWQQRHYGDIWVPVNKVTDGASPTPAYNWKASWHSDGYDPGISAGTGAASEINGSVPSRFA